MTLLDHDSVARTDPQPVHASSRSRWFAMAAALLCVYGLLNLLSSPNGHLLTDVGGKAASLEQMTQRGDLDPTLDYWFRGEDPAGRFFPLDRTTITSDGKFINTTSVSMVLPMQPLYAVGGPRLARIIPMIGALLAALAAAALERRVNPARDGTWSFWLIGAASPALVYANDLWEHSLALAAMAWGVVALFDALHNVRPYRAAMFAGLGYGLASTMRQESLVYGFVAGLVLVVAAALRHRVQRGISLGFVMATSALAPLALHTLYEVVALGGALRLERGTSTATGSFSPSWLDRADSISTTTFALLNGSGSIVHVSGAAFTIALVTMTVRALREATPETSFDDLPPFDRMIRLVVICLFAVALLLYATTFRPVPALVVATPLALVGLVAAVRYRDWFVASVGAAPILLVWLTQFVGGENFQHGSRYMLLSGLILTVAAVAHTADQRPAMFRTVAIMACLIGVYGAAWGVNNINNSAEDAASLTAVTSQDDIVVWRSPTIAREFATLSVGARWLSTESPEDQIALTSTFDDAGIDEFIWVDEFINPITDFPGFHEDERLGELSNFGHNIRRFVRTED